MFAFIVRPFGVKETESDPPHKIDFDRIEKELIDPALAELGIEGRTTGEISEQGNIRTDMFERLLIADIVVADITIQNANVFYELGIRHGMRDRHTLLIRSRGDTVPFDLKTDRYLAYDAERPGESVQELVDALRATLSSQEADSPVFQLLHGLEPVDPTRFQVVPLDFREEVEHAVSRGDRGRLRLLATEAIGFPWEESGYRLVGRAQFKLRDHQSARLTWEAVRKRNDHDEEANTLLGTIFQRLGDLAASTQALRRALGSRTLSDNERAEIYALLGRNAKTLWEADWASLETVEQRQQAALESPHLEDSLEGYSRGFETDRNHFYSGLNALAMAVIMLQLVKQCGDSWCERFETEREAERALQRLRTRRKRLSHAVDLAIASKRRSTGRDEPVDIWAEISAADLVLLTSKKPKRVAYAYRRALANSQDFERASARGQLELFQGLGVLQDNIRAALAVIPKGVEAEASKSRVVLFKGHRIDESSRESSRFPAAAEEQARVMIRQALIEEMELSQNGLIGLAGSASGGDILFHEVCDELAIPTHVYLSLPRDDYLRECVQDAGPDWVERYNRLLDRREEQSPPAVRFLSGSADLPRWLDKKSGYDIGSRSNLWLLETAFAASPGPVTVLALWDGNAGNGAGGTGDMVRRVEERGARLIVLDAGELG